MTVHSGRKAFDGTKTESGGKGAAWEGRIRRLDPVGEHLGQLVGDLHVWLARVSVNVGRESGAWQVRVEATKTTNTGCVSESSGSGKRWDTGLVKSHNLPVLGEFLPATGKL